MQRAYSRLILRGIKNSLSRFFSILGIVALGAGFLAGLLASTPDMKDSADIQYDTLEIYDLDLKGTLGFTSDDVEAVAALEGIEQVIPSHSMDVLLRTQEEKEEIVSRVMGLVDLGNPEELPLNQLELTQGRYPRRADECVLVEPRSYSGGYTLGQSYIFSPENENYEDLEDTWAVEGFTVVGIARSPLFMSIEAERTNIGDGQVDLILYVPHKAFSLEAYTDLYVTVAGAKEENTFADAYWNKTDPVTEALELLGKDRSPVRLQQVREEAEEKLAEAEEEYEEEKAKAEKELDDAEKKIAEGEQEIADGKQKLADARQELADAEQELIDGKKEIADAEIEIADAEQELADNKEFVDQLREALAEGISLDESVIDDYDQAVIDVEEGWKELEKNREQLADAKIALREGREELSKAQQQVDAGWREVNRGRKQLESQKAQAMGQISMLPEEMKGPAMAQLQAQFSAAEEAISAGERELSSGQSDIDTGWELLAENRTLYAEGLKALKEGEQELLDAQKELEENAELIDELRRAREEGLFPLEDQIKKYDDGVKELAEAKQEIADAWVELADGEKKIADAKIEISDAEKELLEGEEKLAEGRQEYEDGRREAEEEFAKAEQKIADAKQEIADIEEPEWLIFTRKDNVGYSGYKDNVEKVAAVCKVFPVFFFLVAALVALTTMTRMVEEERTQIGTLKALGYTDRAILGYYLLYSILASLPGCVLGLSIGFQLLPRVIAGAYNMMFFMPPLRAPFDWGIALLVGPATVLCILAATYASCQNTLRERPATLMVPKAPKIGKRIFLERVTPIWSRMKFTHKVTARNLLRYKKRFFMTVVGVSGCSALLVAGFGVRDSIGGIMPKQFGEIYQYNLTLVVDEENAWETDAVLRELLTDQETVEQFMPFSSLSTDASANGTSQPATLLVPREADRMEEFIVLRDRKSHAPVTFDENAVVVTEKMSEELAVAPGDPIWLEDDDGKKASLTVTGVAENYVAGYVYVGSAAYEKAFGEPPVSKMILAVVPAETEEEREAVSARALRSDQVLYSAFSDTIRDSFQNSVKSIDYIVLVLIVAAGLLSVIVLYNLTNVNICEREKELATIKVLGFYDKEVQAYIFRETVVLSMIGSLMGLLLGTWLHWFVISTVEVNGVMFGRSVYPISYVYSFVISMVFTVLVSVIMRGRVRKIDMVESMKATD